MDPNCERCGLYKSVRSYRIPPEVCRRSEDGKVNVLFFARDPGNVEDEEGRPLSPNAGGGRFIRRMLSYTTGWGYALDNVVSCHTPMNRGPTAVERKCCQPFTLETIEKYDPEILVALGGDALQVLWPGGPKSVAAARTAPARLPSGKWLLTTYHPSPRNIESHGLEFMEKEYIRLFQLIDRLLEGKDVFGTADIRTPVREDVSIILSQIRKEGRVCIDVEHSVHPKDPRRKTFWQNGVEPLCIGIGTTAEQPIWCLPIRLFHSREEWTRFLTEALTGVSVLGHNIKHDLNALWWWFGVPVWDLVERVDDTMLFHGLKDQGKYGNGLKALAERYLGMSDWSMKVTTELTELYALRMQEWKALKQFIKSCGKGLWIPPPPRPLGLQDVSWQTLSAYNGMDIHATMRLWEVFSQEPPPPAYSWVMESLDILARMEHAGLPWDVQQGRAISRAYERKIEELESWIRESKEGRAIRTAWEITAGEPNKMGHPMPPTSPRSPQSFVNSWKFWEALLEVTNLEVPLTTEGRPAVNKTTLPELARRSPLWAAVQAARRYRKILGTFAYPMEDWARTRDGRLHTNFKIIRTQGSSVFDTEQEGGTETGRPAARDPNVLNLVKDPAFGTAIRPGGDAVLVIADFSQMEPRVAAWRSGCRKLLQDANAGRDIYEQVVRRGAKRWGIAHWQPVPDKIRDVCKTLILARMYGQTPEGAAARLSLPLEVVLDAQKFISEEYSELDAYFTGQEEKVSKGLPLSTVFGRSRSFSLDSPGVWNEARNWEIQSTASDLALLQSMKAVRELGLKAVNFMYDALWFTCPRKAFTDIGQEAIHVMEQTAPPFQDLPLQVKLKAGPSLGEAVEVLDFSTPFGRGVKLKKLDYPVA